MAEIPKPLIGRDQSLPIAAPAVVFMRRAFRHCLEDACEVLSDIEVGLVACLMEGDEDLIG